jgi:Tfp pilus assembly protein PilO
MNKLSKEKRTQLMLVSAGILLLLVGLYFTLIRYQQGSLVEYGVKQAATEKKLAEIRETVNNSRQIEAELIVISNQLAQAEEDMPTGDLYASLVNTIRKFKLGRAVEIPQFNSPGTPTDVNLLPKFPYKQTVMTLVGSAHYHDLGKFVADFENEFPSARVLNLELSPGSPTSTDDKEKLAFKMDIVTLVKSTPPTVSVSKL